jgi:hypothetical protein
MRTRKLDANGDVVYGASFASYEVNTPLAVGLAVQSRLEMFVGEWFLNLADGTPWDTQVLGKYTQALRDPALRARILGTPNVTAIDTYSSNLTGRAFSLLSTLTTAYGNSSVDVTASQPI